MSEETESVPVSEEETAPKAPNKLVVMLGNIFTKIKGWLVSRAPRPFTTTVMLLGTLVLLGLGTWQILRTHEKNILLDQVVNGFSDPAINLQTGLPAKAEEWKNLHYRPVILQGTWLEPSYMLRLGPRVYEGTVGYHLIMPLRLENQQIVLVNRGFMPEKMSNLPPPQGKVTVIQGVAYQPENIKPSYVPENVPSRDVWTWIDLTAMAHEVGVKSVAPVMIYEDRVTDRDAYPIGGQLPLPSHNRHWHYAVTWFALALALMVIWMIASNPKPNQKPIPATDGQPESTDPVALRGMYPEATD